MRRRQSRRRSCWRTDPAPAAAVPLTPSSCGSVPAWQRLAVWRHLQSVKTLPVKLLNVVKRAVAAMLEWFVGRWREYACIEKCAVKTSQCSAICSRKKKIWYSKWAVEENETQWHKRQAWIVKVWLFGFRWCFGCFVVGFTEVLLIQLHHLHTAPCNFLEVLDFVTLKRW